MNTFFSWNTQKTAAGFKATVTKNVSRATRNEGGTFVDTTIVTTGTFATRARAKGWAQRNLRALKRAA